MPSSPRLAASPPSRGSQPAFFEMYKDAIKNTYTVDEVDFSTDLVDLRERMLPSRSASPAK